MRIRLATLTIRLACIASLWLPQFNTNAQPPPAAASAAPAAGQTPAPPAVSPAVSEVLRLAQSGVSEDVVTAYINNSPAPFNLSSDQILYVRDLGLSSQVITAMLNRDASLRNQPQPSQPAPEPQPAPAPDAPPPHKPPPPPPHRPPPPSRRRHRSRPSRWNPHGLLLPLKSPLRPCR